MAYTDIIIAVHGIGDQSRNSTVRSVATRLAQCGSLAGDKLAFAPQPLGYFHTDVEDAVRVCPLDSIANLGGGLTNTGFAEVFWADIPRGVVKEGRTLEETKAWARTVVARARNVFAKASERAVKKQARDQLHGPDFSLAAEVLEEIVDTVYVLENLLAVAKRAGVFEFDLRAVLEEYLGDVQIVTEFTLYRNDIVGRFHRAMEQISAANPGARLHIVAHSEGTVISFLGLLHAMSHERLVPGVKEKLMPLDAVPPWLKQVRGYMTIGSPIDKHILLWPHLFQDFEIAKGRAELTHRIRWRNYYDYGDPIGFKLETARRWLDSREDRVFQFCGCPRCEHDIGFARYMLPGKAHNDYWEDPEVFEHFVRDVILPKQDLKREEGETGRPRPPVPKHRPRVRGLSPTLPYVGSFLVLFAGVFLLYKGVVAYLYPNLDPLDRFVGFTMGSAIGEDIPGWRILLNALGVTGLIAGTTLAARFPRLALGWRWRAAAVAAFAIGCACYLGLESPERDKIGEVFGNLFKHQPPDSKDPSWLAKQAPTIGVLALAAIVSAFGLWATHKPKKDSSGETLSRHQRWFWRGMRPLIVCGAIGIALIVVPRMIARAGNGDPAELQSVISTDPPVWPLLLAGAAFLYLWWLATLLFDLSFVWQRYVRNSVALDRLHNWTFHDSSSKPGSKKGKPPPEACREEPARNSVEWPVDKEPEPRPSK